MFIITQNRSIDTVSNDEFLNFVLDNLIKNYKIPVIKHRNYSILHTTQEYSIQLYATLANTVEEVIRYARLLVK